MHVNTITGNLNIEAKGGKGGDAVSSRPYYYRGSGGGGGGGIVFFNSTTGTSNINVLKGSAGNAYSGFKGTDGTDGMVKNNELIINLNCLLQQNSIQSNQTICYGNTPNLLTGTTSTLFLTYLWQYSTDNNTWYNCPGTNNQPNYQPGTLTQTTYFRRLVTLLGGDVDISNVLTISVNNYQLSFNKTDVTCNGQCNGTATALVLPNTGVFGYHWHNGQNTQTINNLCAGLYYVTVTDANNCSISGMVEITEPTQLIASIAKSDVTCYGQNNGTATVSVFGGVPNYTFNWNNGATQSSITNLSAGTYFVTVTDSHGCTTSQSVTITEPQPIQISTNKTNPSCYGYSDGNIQTQVLGGTQPYTYQWNNGATTQNLTNLSTGTYTLTVTDHNGCTNTHSVSLSQPNPLQINLQYIGHVSCYNGNNGYINTYASGGTQPYSYLWNIGSTSSSISNVYAGTYYLTVTDNNNCIEIDTFIIQQPQDLSLITSIQNPTCVYSCNGSISFSAQGGTMPYSYNYPNPISNLCQGTYTIVVTDNNQCTKAATVNLIPQTIIQNNIIQSNNSPFCMFDTITINGSNPTGSGSFNFLWQWSIDGINWQNAQLPNYHPNYLWTADQSRYFRRIVIGSGCYDTSNVLYFNVVYISNNIQTSDSIYCFGDQIYPITGNEDSLFNYIWQYNAGNGWITMPDQTPYIYPLTQFNYTQYRRIVSAPYSCVDTSNIISITIINIENNQITINQSSTVEQFCGIANGIISGPLANSSCHIIWQTSLDSTQWSTLPDTTISIYFSLSDNSHRYYYYRRIIELMGCFDTSNVVVVDLLPYILNVIETSAGLNDTIHICQDDVIAIGSFINQPSGGTGSFHYLWIYKTSIGTWAPAPGINNMKNYLAGSISDTISFARIITSGACIDTSNIITIIPVLLPHNEINSTQLTYCEGETIQPITETQNTQGTNVSYQWQVLQGNQWTDITGATQQSFTPPFIVGSNKYRRMIFNGNCSSASNEVIINCNLQTFALISLEENDSICKLSDTYAHIHLHLEGVAPWNVTFSLNGNHFTQQQHQNDSVYSIYIQQSYFEIFIVQLTDNSNCTAIIPPDTIRIWAFNPVSAHSTSTEECGLSTTLQATPPAEGIGTWILPSCITTNDIHSSTTQIFSTQYGTFDIIWEVRNGPCVDTNHTTLTLYQQPSQPDAGQDITLYNSNPIVHLQATPPDAGQGTWSVIEGNAVFSEPHSPTTLVSQLSEGNNILRWTITNGICPPVFDDVLIRLFSLFIPEGFSPNGDGKNDYFVIDGLDPGISYHLTIFERWGNIVYENPSYDNSWNGKDKNGNDLPDDTYFYMLEKDKKIIQKGYVILKR